MRVGKPGNLYILSNPTQPGFLKIGKTTYHPGDRAKALSRETGVAGDFKVEYGCVTSDVDRAEDYIKNYLAPFRTGKQKEHLREIGLAFAKRVLNNAAERYGLPLTDLENEYDIRVRGIYVVVDNTISVKNAVRHINDLCKRHYDYNNAQNVWGEPDIFLMTDYLIQNALKLPFTASYTREFKSCLMTSAAIKGFHVMAELGRSHQIDRFNQYTRLANLEGELCQQTMRYQDWTGIHSSSRFAYIPVPKSPFLYERIDHDSMRWETTSMASKFHEKRFESNLCSLLDPAHESAYCTSYNYPIRSVYGQFLESHFDDCLQTR